MNARETAWRVFAGELTSSSYEKKAADEKSPSYLITPLGAMINRVVIAGVLTDKQNRGSDEEPLWSGRIEDVTGSITISVGGRYQPEAAVAMLDLEIGTPVMVIGKIKVFTTDDGRTFVSVRPERIIDITKKGDSETDKYDLWILEAAKSMWNRLVRMRTALKIPDVTANALIEKGYSSQEAEGISTAIEVYGFPASEKYLKYMQTALRALLGDDVDLGLAGDTSSMPDEIEDAPANSSGESSNANSADKEDIILRILEELDGPDGVLFDDICRQAEAEGIFTNDVEEITNALMDKGLVYEPKLGYMKII